MSEVVHDELPGHPVAVLTGPNLAKEVLAGQPAASVVAIDDETIATELQRIFATMRLRVYTNPDLVGCEVAGVVKNVIAIASGMAEGMGFGDNTRATLITRGLAEMSRLGVSLGGAPLTFAGLAGMGDLIATCSSRQSRNNTVGYQLGQGRSIDEIVGEMHMVAEGVKSSPSVLALAEAHGVDMPITEQVVEVCHHGADRRRGPHRAHAAGRQAGAGAVATRGTPVIRPATGHTIGVVGQTWRAWVSPGGALLADDGSALLDWWVAAEDRWHTPSRELTCRQRLVDGVPVVETAIRVPGGDVRQTVYAVADGGGLAVVALENRSPAPIAQSRSAAGTC